jgi:PPE-repeat protein
MDFAMLPPEVNSGRIYAGPGAGPMLAAAAAWDGVAGELHSTAASFGSVISGLTGGPWLGPAAASMAAAVAPYLTWMSTTAAQAEQSATQARAAAAAYEAAFAMTVAPPVIAANRSLLATLVATNIFGQNTPAIAATEADYAEMWGQDAAAMYGYAGSSAAASALTPFTAPPPTTNPAQAATTAQSIMSSGPQLMSALPQALQGLASTSAAADPAQALTTLATLVTLVAIPVAGIDTVAASTSAPASFISGPASILSASTTYRGMLINADRDYAQGNGPFFGTGPGAGMLNEWIFGGAGGIGAPSTAAVPSSVAAGLGQATPVGALSVPPGWASTAPTLRPVAYALPMTAADATPAMVAGNPGGLFGEMALAGMAGNAVGSAAAPGRGNERLRHNGRRTTSQPAQRPQGEALTDIVAELKALAARTQSLLTQLHDAGLMTDQEVADQKGRLLGNS